jgi:hypothetical protein
MSSAAPELLDLAKALARAAVKRDIARALESRPTGSGDGLAVGGAGACPAGLAVGGGNRYAHDHLRPLQQR